MAATSSSSRTCRTGAKTGSTCTTRTGQLFSLPAGWTDVAAADPFVVMTAGRCAFTADGLLAVADLLDRSARSATATGM
jgi:hypothetical protein